MEGRKVCLNLPRAMVVQLDDWADWRMTSRGAVIRFILWEALRQEAKSNQPIELEEATE